MDYIPFTSTHEFQRLKRLSKNLSICSGNRQIHLSCVLEVEEIADDCKKIADWLEKCIELNGTNRDLHPALDACLSQLCDSVAVLPFEFLDIPERFHDLHLSISLLKVLYDFFILYPTVLVDMRSPRDLRERLHSELGRRGTDDPVCKRLMELPNLAKFLDDETAEEKYLFLVNNVIAQFRDAKHVKHEEDVQEIVDRIPVGFKFSAEMFGKLFDLEAFMLCCDRADKQLHQFYKLLFFAYEHADNQAETCQLYANQGHYLVGQQQLRTTATQDLFLAAAGQIMNAIIGGQSSKFEHLFQWLYVLDPTSPLVSEAERFKQLPVLPDKIH